MQIDRKLLEAIRDQAKMPFGMAKSVEELLRRDDIETAYKSGAKIEAKRIHNGPIKDTWDALADPSFKWDTFDYRIQERTMAEWRDDIIDRLEVYSGPVKNDVLTFLKEIDL